MAIIASIPAILDQLHPRERPELLAGFSGFGIFLQIASKTVCSIRKSD